MIIIIISKAVKSEVKSVSKVNSSSSSSSKKSKEKSSSSGGGGGGGFTALCDLSPELSKFLGVEGTIIIIIIITIIIIIKTLEMSRTQVVSKMWEYIKANNLQNPNDKVLILLIFLH